MHPPRLLHPPLINQKVVALLCPVVMEVTLMMAGTGIMTTRMKTLMTPAWVPLSLALNRRTPRMWGLAKIYKAQTPNGKAMVKMFRRFCDLTDRDASAIVVYFGVYSESRLAEFLHDHWKDTFTQWQKRHPNQDGTERAMVLSPLQQDHIKCATWACWHRGPVPWPMDYFSIKELKSRHFEPIRAQMECKD
jgi:hypothetical protein